MSPPFFPPQSRPKLSSFNSYINPNPIPDSNLNLGHHLSASNVHATQNALNALQSILPRQTEAEVDEILCAAWPTGSKVPTNPSSKVHAQQEKGRGKEDTEMEEMIQLRIRTAVLENDLKHAKQAKESLMNSLTVILGVLTGQVSASPGPTSAHNTPVVPKSAAVARDGDDVRILEKEIERLRRENRGLRNDAKRASRQSQPRSPSLVVENETARQHDTSDERGRLRRLFPRDPTYSGPGLTALAGSWAKSTKSPPTAQSFETGISTVPNTPLARSFGGDAWKGKGNGNGNADVGINTSGEWEGESVDGDESSPLPGGDEVLPTRTHSAGVTTPEEDREQEDVSADESTSWGLSARHHHQVSAEDIMAASMNGYHDKSEAYPSSHSPPASQQQRQHSEPPTPSTSTPQPLSSCSSSSSFRQTTPLKDAQIADLSSILDNRVSPSHQQQIDQQLPAAMENPTSMPKPGKLMVNTDLDPSTSFRGKEYDYLKMIKAQADRFPAGPRGMRGGGGEGPWRDLGLRRDDTLDTLRDGVGERGGGSIGFGNGQLPKIWDDSEQREGAIKTSNELGGRHERFPDFFKYGLQFVPDSTTSNFKRTVTISDLSEDVTLREVLARVRGGEILSAALTNTTSLTGSYTARVVFKHEAAAQEYTVWASKNSIIFGEGKVLAQVTLVTSPTWPSRSYIAVRMQKNPTTTHSRCFRITNFPENLSIREFERELACRIHLRAEALLEIYLDREANLHLEYASVDMALSAVDMFHKKPFRKYGLRYEWESDPCAGPLKELFEEVKPRPPVLPRSLSSPLAPEDSSHSNQHRRSFTQDRAGDGLDEEVLNLHRKPLGALTHQKVVIPSFSTDRLQGPSWADEMEEEEENACVSGTQSSAAQVDGGDSGMLDCPS